MRSLGELTPNIISILLLFTFLPCYYRLQSYVFFLISQKKSEEKTAGVLKHKKRSSALPSRITNPAEQGISICNARIIK